MPNYGHAVQFGVLIGPESTAQESADLAAHAERAGLDLAAFAAREMSGGAAVAGSDDAAAASWMDDDEASAGAAPGEGTAAGTMMDDDGASAAAGPDPWTMASWAAALTERLTVAVTGLTTANRPPSVLARAAGSLSLLSGDRAALALAAGRVAGDGDRDAELTDAIAVLRAVADISAEEATYLGSHHAIDGAQPGPVLDREVPLWLTGSDDPAARLAGAQSDGLVLDLDAAGGPGGLAHLNTVIDEAAASHDRDPREIRRLVILPGSGDRAAQVSAEDLVRFVVDHGVSGLVIRKTAPADVERFARAAAQARQTIAEALPDLGSRRNRRASARAKRHPGIDYDGVPDSLAQTAVEPGDPGYPRVRSNYMRGGNPGLVLRPENVRQVVDAVGYARRNPHLELGIRSGGHGISGRSTNNGGLVLDVGRMNAVEVVDEASRLVRLGPGARWRDVASALQPHGWAIGSGDYGGVGVGGLVTAGGLGFLSRHHGLTIDNLRAADLVLADGSQIRASEEENPEVFWAVRGAGANLGIVTSVEITASPVDQVGWAQLGFTVRDVAQFLADFGRVATSAPRQTTAFLIMGPARGGSATAQVMAMVDSTDPDVVIEQLQPFAQIPTMIQQQVVIAPYAAVMNMFPEAPHQGRGEPVARSGLVNEVTPEFTEAGAQLLDSGTIGWFQLRTMGGAIGDMPAEATAFVHRDAVMHLTVMGSNAQRVDRHWENIRKHVDGLYLSFETDRSPQRLVEAFGEQGLARLRRLKAQLDPHQLFRDNFPIPPGDPPADGDPSAHAVPPAHAVPSAHADRPGGAHD